jgi:hypothetical protein
MNNYNLKNGQTYEADITLSGLQLFGSNDDVKAELSKAGFINITVTGSGKNRKAIGTWAGNTLEAPVPKEVSGIKELN